MTTHELSEIREQYAITLANAERLQAERDSLREKLQAAERAITELRLELDGDDLTLHDKIRLGEDALLQALDLAQKNERRAETAERELSKMRAERDLLRECFDNEVEIRKEAEHQAEQARAEGYERGEADARRGCGRPVCLDWSRPAKDPTP